MPGPGVQRAPAKSELEDLLEAKRSAAKAFLTRESSPVAARAFAVSLAPKHNVVGVGVGSKYVRGKSSAQMAVRFYVEKKVAKHAVPSELMLPAKWQGLPTDVIETGVFMALPAAGTALAATKAHPERRKMRPARPGCSIGFQFPPPNQGFVMAGTFGAVVKQGSQHFILSNNHVLADENGLKPGARIFQPGLLDNGNDATDGIAKLTQFEPLDASHPNAVDCAIAALDAAKLASGRFLAKVNKLKSGTPIAAVERMAVMKVGRTTGYTEGVIFDISADVTVGYDLGDLSFEDQILIRGTGKTPKFSDAGDSGSLIVHRTKRAPVGLLFAGSSTFTIANPIAEVLQRLNVSIVI